VPASSAVAQGAGIRDELLDAAGGDGEAGGGLGGGEGGHYSKPGRVD